MNATRIDASRRPPDSDADDRNHVPPVYKPLSERASRAAALERYETLVSSANGLANGSWGGCMPVPVVNPVLFRTEGGEADAVDVHDVQQGPIGDCFVMAPLAGLAGTPEGRALIKGAIAENRTSGGGVVSYTVTLHKPESHWPGPKTFTDVKVILTEPFLCRHAVARADGNRNEVWPLVIEKAYAEYCGCNPNSGRVSDAMEVLTGREATCIDLEWFGRYDLGTLERDLAAGKVVVLATKTSIGGNEGRGTTQRQNDDHRAAHNLYGRHAYLLTGIEECNGTLCLRLHNPWNTEDPTPVPFGELKKWFSSVNIATTR